ncbi:catechol 2,3-dioxygenase [Curtobacterium sp. PhB130]|uniref:VOC family protein n=1 Tax=unclassified Curtobacterium TaxID=257496 RepID=UPI000F4B73EF|nr:MULTISPECIES: VOC family protein [unclassified Curtobacterium]ROS78378.1 catechol 2,3-dioxygenase [Curtobacterium sp. PhB130]TCK65304.1 catechol 2,3-dioxygenase [Curtobacterium sp. PhB136]
MHTQDLLAADTGMGAVTLRVANLDRMIGYYREGIGLSLFANDGGVAVLGRPSPSGVAVPIVILEHSPALAHAGAHEAGLFHTAILFDTKADLAAALYSVATKYPQTFTGSADHLVSFAFYCTDPEGNGVELYWDRDRTAWSWTHGMVDMDTKYVDPNAFLQEHLTSSALESTATTPGRVGHVHLSVGDVTAAKDFYVDKLGFATTAGWGEALFVSAGGYHHHMAMNTWNSRGAGRRQLALGLGLVRIEVPGTDDLGALTTRMRDHGVQTADDGRTVALEDPWSNRIEVTAPGRG